MCVSASRPHLCIHSDGFHDFLLFGALFYGKLGMALDAIRALGNMRHSHSNKLLGFLRQGAFGEYGRAKGLECSLYLGCQFSPLLGKLFGHNGVYRLIYAVSPEVKNNEAGNLWLHDNPSVFTVSSSSAERRVGQDCVSTFIYRL